MPLAPREKPIVPVDILSNRYLKNNLKIDYKQRLPCFCRYYGANFEKSFAVIVEVFSVDFSAKQVEQT